MRFLTGLTLGVLVVGALPIGLACSSSPTSPSTTTTAATATTASTSNATTTPSATTLATMYSKFTNGVTVQLSGATVVLTSNGVPDHKSPYFGVGNAQYEAPQAGMVVNPNLIASQNFVMRVPASPTATTPSDTPLGAMGMAVNGVALFNQYAAGRQPLTFEILSFDRYNGHPQQTGVYHYHIDPVWITGANQSALVGILLDGFPVYGSKDMDGSTPSGLDSCNGHLGVTPDFPNGIYHYHVTAAVPYIAGCFKGTPGSASE